MDTQVQRETKIDQFEKFLGLIEQHEDIGIPDVISFPIVIGVVSSAPRTRKPRVALGSDPLPGKKK